MDKIVMEMPDRNTPGFLRRSKQALEFQKKLRAPNMEPTVFDEMIEFILPFVKEPVDRDTARNMLWDASQEQFEKVMASLVGGSEASVPPPSTTTLPNSIS